MLSVLVGTLLGGLALFIWNAISWMMLPWHHAVYSRFKDEDAIGRALIDQAADDGVYGIPAPPEKSPGMDKAQRDAADLTVYNKMKKGPLVTVVFQRTGYASIAPKLAIALVTGMIVSFVFSVLLLNFGRDLTLARSALLVALGAFGGILATRIPDWNWHGFTKSFVAVQIVDVAIGCYLTGLVVAWVSIGFR